ncbi:MAG: type II secretion system protein GspG [Candidatus Omnitrophica bacterium]|nr:type II secretion system protein GspG [Candidatus Omnitrophota bacterium]
MIREGFTLIELIVVIAIIAILAAIIAPNAFKAIEKAKVSKVVSDLKTLKTAAMSYYGDTGQWPPDVCPNDDPGFMSHDAFLTACCITVPNGDIPAFIALIEDYWDGPYLEGGFPNSTPWGGSYDWEWWPSGAVVWQMPPGCYISARAKWDSTPAVCGFAVGNSGTEVPANAEVRLQQQDFDRHLLPAPATVDDPSGLVILTIANF